jgi:DNA repair protein RecO (recombination protein O)
MFIHYRTRAVLIKEEARGEGDILLTFFSQEYGRIEVLARSLRKIKSKLRSSLELFSLIQIEYIQGKHYKTLTDALRIKNYKGIKESPAKLKIAFYIADILERLIHSQEKDDGIWQLLLDTLDRLENHQLVRGDDYFNFSNESLLEKHWDLKLMYYYFFWSLIETLGYKPELYYCPLCQKRLKPSELYFSFQEGGVICEHCFSKLEEKEKMSCLKVGPELVKVIRLLVEKKWSLLKRLEVKKKEKEAIDRLLIQSVELNEFLS